MEILQHRIAKALQNHIFCKSPLQSGVCDECADFVVVAHTVSRALPLCHELPRWQSGSGGEKVSQITKDGFRRVKDASAHRSVSPKRLSFHAQTHYRCRADISGTNPVDEEFLLDCRKTPSDDERETA